MERRELEQAATPEQMAAAIDQQPEEMSRLHEAHEHPGTSVREVVYKGHRIRIVTTYEIEVDGVPITGHLLVNNEGRVHYHAIPNEEFASTVDMVERIIDLSPEGLDPGSGTPGEHDGHGGDDHGGHDHGHPH